MTMHQVVPKGERNGRNDSIGLLAAGCLLVWFLLAYRPFPTEDLILPAVVTLFFALAGWVSRGVAPSGAVAGWVIAFILYGIGGIRLFGVLFVVFASTWTATRLGSLRKERLGVAESKRGRGASQVMANLFWAGVFAVLTFLAEGPDPLFFTACIAALCEAAADTVSSEVGVASGKSPVLITTLKPVAPGMNGGITLYGSTAGAMAACAVMVCAQLAVPSAGLYYRKVLSLSAVAGIFGMFVDSLLGATLERRGYLNNDLVNLLGTASAAGLALLLTTIY